MDKFSEILGKFATTISANRYISTIKDSFIETIPLTILGSIGVLLGSVLFSTNGLGSVKGFTFLLDVCPWFNQLNYATMNILSLIVAINMGKNLAKTYGRDGHFEGILALVCFILVSPTTVTAIFGEETQVVSNVLSTSVTSSQGLFVAMIVSLLSVTMFCKLTKIDKLKINLPDAVPPNVAKTFSDLIPTIMVGFVISGFAFAFQWLVGENISTVIFEVLQKPITMAFQYPIGIVFVAAFAALLWICGIHGASIATGIINPIMYVSLQTNMDLVAAGKPATEIMAKPFWNLFITQGGFGCTLALIIAIFIVGKREDDKSIAKLSLAPGLFGINEPMIFGIPIVMNPIMAIPFILCPVVCALIGYFAMSAGFAGMIISDIPWCMPPVVNGFIATGGNIGMVITQIICIVISVLIWIPFVSIRNKEVASRG